MKHLLRMHHSTLSSRRSFWCVERHFVLISLRPDDIKYHSLAVLFLSGICCRGCTGGRNQREEIKHDQRLFCDAWHSSHRTLSRFCVGAGKSYLSSQRHRDHHLCLLHRSLRHRSEGREVCSNEHTFRPSVPCWIIVFFTSGVSLSRTPSSSTSSSSSCSGP